MLVKEIVFTRPLGGRHYGSTPSENSLSGRLKASIFLNGRSLAAECPQKTALPTNLRGNFRRWRCQKHGFAPRAASSKATTVAASFAGDRTPHGTAWLIGGREDGAVACVSAPTATHGGTRTLGWLMEGGSPPSPPLAPAAWTPSRAGANPQILTTRPENRSYNDPRQLHQNRIRRTRCQNML